MIWGLFKKAEAKPKRFARAQRYKYTVALSQDIPGVTTRNMMRVEATSEENAKHLALDEVKRTSGIILNSSDIVGVTGGKRPV